MTNYNGVALRHRDFWLLIQRPNPKRRDDLEQAEHNEPDAGDNCENGQRSDWPDQDDNTGDDPQNSEEDIEAPAGIARADSDLHNAAHDPPDCEEQDEELNAAFHALQTDNAQHDSNDTCDRVQDSTDRLQTSPERFE